MDKLKTLHKWTSLLVGVQVVIWLITGCFFNLMDGNKASGRQYRTSVPYHSILDTEGLKSPQYILNQAKEATSLKVIQLLGQPYYLVNHHQGLYPHFYNRHSLYHGLTGGKTEIDKTFAQQIALQSYTGSGEIITSVHIENNIEDFPKQQNPVWRINFNDEVKTSVYIEAETGRIVGHSDDDKRFADIFFMLHFMDYGTQGSFNSIQIMLFAFITLWLTLTGFIWTISLAFNGQYKFQFLSRKQSVKVFNNEGEQSLILKLSSHQNLYSELAEHDIHLSSNCGGGGTCGMCRVVISPSSTITDADKTNLSKRNLSQGCRLACQHFAKTDQTITIPSIPIK